MATEVKVLVTGSSGLVGHGLRKAVSDANDHSYVFKYLTSKNGDLTREDDVKAVFEEHKPDVVVHLAANVGGLFKNMNQKAKMYEDNTLMNVFILKYCRIFNVKKCILCLSTCIFPDKVTYPITEDQLHAGPPHFSNEGYAYAKRMMEVHGRILSEQHGIDVVCLCPTNLYGAYDNFNLADAHVIPALIHKCYLAKKENKPFIVCGSGKPLRQFIHANDFGRIILNGITKYKTGVYICSPPAEKELSIGHVATQIAKNMHYEHAMQFDVSFSDGQFKKTVQPHNILNGFDFTEFDVGIAEVVEWFLNEIKSDKVVKKIRI